MHTSSHTVLYDPDGLIEAELPLDREPYECLVKAVLAWTGQDTLTTRDYEQIALQLTGHARALAADVRRRADQLPKDSGPKALADVVLREAEDLPTRSAPSRASRAGTRPSPRTASPGRGPGPGRSARAWTTPHPGRRTPRWSESGRAPRSPGPERADRLCGRSAQCRSAAPPVRPWPAKDPAAPAHAPVVCVDSSNHVVRTTASELASEMSRTRHTLFIRPGSCVATVTRTWSSRDASGTSSGVSSR